MGIYIMDPAVREFIEPDDHLDLPNLVRILIEAGEPVGGFVHDGYWLDIGRHEDYERALTDPDARDVVDAERADGDRISRRSDPMPEETAIHPHRSMPRCPSRCAPRAAFPSARSLRFVAVGGASYFFNLGTYSLGLWVGLPYLLAATISFAIGFAFNFLANRHWTFVAGGSQAGGQFVRFSCVAALGARASTSCCCGARSRCSTCTRSSRRAS